MSKVTTKPTTRVYPITNSMSTVMRVLASGSHTPKLIGDRLNIDRGNVHRKLKALVKRGLVNYDKAGRMYFLSTEGQKKAVEKAQEHVTTETPRGVRTDNRTDNGGGVLSLHRGHNIRVKFPILSCPKGWRQSPKVFFESRRVDARPLGLKNVDGVEYVLDNLRFRMTSSSVGISLRVAEYRDAPSLLEWLIPLMIEQRDKLQKEFPQLRLDHRPIIMWGELAHLGDPVAELRKSKGFHVIRATDGRARVQFDFSEGKIEIEFLHPGMFDSDSETWDRRIKQLLDSPYDYDLLGIMAEEAGYRLDEQDSRIRGLIQASELIVRNQDVFDKNMVSHLAVLHKLGAAVDRLGGAVSGRSVKRPRGSQVELGRFLQ